ncbi:hypothetical protein ColKHC_11862 [Colletotrichum higginsianum]|nr:hypothetical protein ColKHC_11862 [Colletotrichum higginsianum]
MLPESERLQAQNLRRGFEIPASKNGGFGSDGPRASTRRHGRRGNMPTRSLGKIAVGAFDSSHVWRFWEIQLDV